MPVYMLSDIKRLQRQLMMTSSEGVSRIVKFERCGGEPRLQSLKEDECSKGDRGVELDEDGDNSG